jgi:hypothetical protein
MVKRLAHFLEMLGGARELPPGLEQRKVTSLAIGIYWALLLLLVISFAGRTAKFIYVDF